MMPYFVDGLGAAQGSGVVLFLGGEPLPGRPGLQLQPEGPPQRGPVQLGTTGDVIVPEERRILSGKLLVGPAHVGIGQAVLSMSVPEQGEELRQACLASAAFADGSIHEPGHHLALLVITDGAVGAEFMRLVETDPGIPAGFLQALLQAAWPLHLLAPAAGQFLRRMAPGHYTRPEGDDMLHVGGQPLVEPEQFRGVLATVVEGTEHRVVEALHVPGVEELVRHQLVERVVALGPVTGGFLLEHFFWGSVFMVNVPVIVVAMVAIWRVVPTSRDTTIRRFDPLGIVLSIAGVTLLVWTLVVGGRPVWP